MPDRYPIGSSPVFVSVTTEQMTVQNIGSATVYYGASAFTSSTTNDGSIAALATATVTGGLYFVAATLTHTSLMVTAVTETTEGETMTGTAQRVGNRSVFIGDSTCVVWPNDFCVKSFQRAQMVANLAVSGQTSSDVLARLAAEAFTLDFDRLFLMTGNNDVVTMGTAMDAGNNQVATPPASFAAAFVNYETIIQRVLAEGKDLVLCTITPRATNTWHAGHNRYNSFIKKMANAYGLALFDFHKVLTDPANGDPLSGVMSDGTHPYTVLGRKTMVDEALAVGALYDWWGRGDMAGRPDAPPEGWIGTANLVNGSPTAAAFSTVSGDVQPGMRVQGTGIPAGTTIQRISGSDLILSANATSSGTTVGLTAVETTNIFYDPAAPTETGFFLTATSGIAAGFGAIQGGGGATPTTATATNVKGKVQRLTKAGATTLEVALEPVNGAAETVLYSTTIDVDGLVVYEMTLPALTARLDFFMRLLGSGTSQLPWSGTNGLGFSAGDKITVRFRVITDLESGNGAVAIGEVTIENRTAAGLV